MASLHSRAVANSSASSSGSLTDERTATSSMASPLSSFALARISRTRAASLVDAECIASSMAASSMNVPVSTTAVMNYSLGRQLEARRSPP